MLYTYQSLRCLLNGELVYVVGVLSAHVSPVFSQRSLRILIGKKHPKIKLQHLRKIRIWTFGSLLHQVNSFQEVLKLKQIFEKSEAVIGKTPLFVIGQFCSRHSICLNIGFWQGSFGSKWCVFNLSVFN